MRKIITTLAGLFTAAAALAGGNTMNYQAVLRNADGTVAADKNIGIRFRILSGDTDSQLFSEAVSVKTNERGMVDCAIGSTATNGLNSIDWSSDDIRLEVGIDMNGGTDYSAVYMSEIRSVAKSLYATHSGDTEELRNEIYSIYPMVDRANENVYILEARFDDFRDYVDDNINNLSAMMDDQLMMVYDLRGDVEAVKMYSDESRARINYLEMKVGEQEDLIHALEERIVYLLNEVENLRNQIQ